MNEGVNTITIPIFLLVNSYLLIVNLIDFVFIFHSVFFGKILVIK